MNLHPDPRFNTLIGTKVGKLTVVEYQVKGRWKVRCECGQEEVRNTQALLNKNNTDDKCIECRKTPKEILAPIEPIRNKTPDRGKCGKMKFKSESAVDKAMKSRLRKGANCNRLRSYFCKECKAWHMSSSF